MDDKNLCKFCNKIFASKSSLWNHQNKDPSTSICSYHMEEEKKRRTNDRIEKVIPLYDYNADKTKDEQISIQNSYTKEVLRIEEKKEDIKDEYEHLNDPFYSTDLKKINDKI